MVLGGHEAIDRLDLEMHFRRLDRFRHSLLCSSLLVDFCRAGGKDSGPLPTHGIQGPCRIPCLHVFAASQATAFKFNCVTANPAEHVCADRWVCRRVREAVDPHAGTRVWPYLCFQLCFQLHAGGHALRPWAPRAPVCKASGVGLWPRRWESSMWSWPFTTLGLNISLVCFRILEQHMDHVGRQPENYEALGIRFYRARKAAPGWYLQFVQSATPVPSECDATCQSTGDAASTVSFRGWHYDEGG